MVSPSRSSPVPHPLKFITPSPWIHTNRHHHHHHHPQPHHLKTNKPKENKTNKGEKEQGTHTATETHKFAQAGGFRERVWGSMAEGPLLYCLEREKELKGEGKESVEARERREKKEQSTWAYVYGNSIMKHCFQDQMSTAGLDVCNHT